MFKTIFSYLSAEELARCQTEIDKENRLAIQLLILVGLPLSVANIFAQSIITGSDLLSPRSYWLFLYFGALLLWERFLLPENIRRTTLLIYLVEAPALITSILLGTVWDPGHQAITFLIFLMAMPVFLIDRPLRVLSVFAGWSAVFLLICLQVKDAALFRADAIHVLECFLASAAVTFVVLRVRLDSLRHLEQARFHLEHDELTGCRNRRSLHMRAERYLGKPLLVLLGDMDQLTLFNDFYGHAVGDEMLVTFANTLTASFGADNTYRYGGDEMLCIAPDPSEQDCLAKMAACREQLHHKDFNGRAATLTCAFGYVIGTPTSVKEFEEMLQLADIYAHKAGKSGQDQTVGGPFDAVHLRAGIVESNLATHARAFETNQLTGLPSMSYFFSRADELLSHIADLSRRPMVGFFNLLHFRNYNDEFGYAQGDALICHTARLLQQAFNSRHICYITGSQFGILCYEDEIAPGLAAVNEALQSFNPVYPVCSKAGFACYTGTESAISLLDKAKVAHDSIYDQKPESFRIYDAKLDEESRFRQYLVTHVDEAIEKGYLKVYYQPIARTITGEVCNEEALSRWDDPLYGFLSPFQFIPSLEESRQLYKVNLHVVKQVLEDFQRKEALGVPVVPVSVNLSRHDFEQCDMVKEITDLVDASGYARSMIKIEITESAFIENQELLKRELNRLREKGFEIWLDDFGSEYSTLNLLQELNFDLIKLDMQFMKNFSTSSRNMIIVSNILEMARRMGITTLIEGIETQEHYQILRRLGCEKLQGFLFNKPNPLEYIIDRALSQTGLNFESAAEASYYEAVGHVDLDEPSLGEGRRSDGEPEQILPAGVLEFREGKLTCFRGNEHFFPRMQELGLLPAARMGTGRQALVDPPPAALAENAAACLESDDWVSFPLEGVRGDSVMFRMKKLAVNSVTGGTALLSVLAEAADPTV